MAKRTLGARLRDELRAIGEDYKAVGRIAIYGRKKKKKAAKRRTAKSRSAVAKKSKTKKTKTRATRKKASKKAARHK